MSLDAAARLVRETGFEHSLAVRLPGDERLDEGVGSLPLASTFKVPLARVVLERLDLAERVRLRDDDRTLYGPLECVSAGAELSLADLLRQMLIWSDNTATSVLHNRVGAHAVDDWLVARGTDGTSTDITYRDAYLLLAYPARWDGLGLAERAAELDALDADGRADLLAEARGEAAGVGPEALRERCAAAGTDIDDDEAPGVAAFDRSTDCQGTAGALADSLADAPETLLAIMRRCEDRQRLPAGLTEAAWVANKTGSVTGVVNDCSVFPTPSGGLAIVALLLASVAPGERERADELHRAVARAVWAATAPA